MWSKRLVGWKVSVTWFISGSLVVFFLNLGVLIWAATKANNVTDDGSVILQHSSTTGACEKQKQTDIWAHLLINILSTIILSGSNYCMQCLSAPTRDDIDAAHNQGLYLDIGVSNFRNLYHVKWRRGFLWLALAVSSLPLHLFFNSAVYGSTTANNYIAYSVAPDFVEVGAPGNISSYKDAIGALKMTAGYRSLGSPTAAVADVLTRLQNSARANQLTRLSNVECINAYVQSFQSNYRSVILVTENGTDTVNYVELRFWRDFQCYNRQPYIWTCGYAQDPPSNTCPTDCDQPEIRNTILDDAATGRWAPFGDNVQYCLAETSEKQCQLQFNMPIAITVVSLNMAKIILMMVVMLKAFPKKQNPILTSGDAANSFLTEPDRTTRFRCLASRKSVLDGDKIDVGGTLGKGHHNGAIWLPAPEAYSAKRLRWGKAISIRRWCFNLIIYAIGLGVAGVYLKIGITALAGSKDLATLWRMGIGSASITAGGGAKAIVFSDDQANLRGAALLLRMVLYANIPQLILSLLYFSYNAIFTIMLMAYEWSTFAKEKKGLRVAATNPVGEQRESYWLQLPFRWSIPLIVCSVALHWLVSQSIFVVDVMFTGYDGELLHYPRDKLEVDHLISLGYSPIAIILVLIVGVILIAFILGLATLRRFASAMPLVGTNSAAISSACHTIEKHSGIAERRLQWGETDKWPADEVLQSRSLLQDQPSWYEPSNAASNSGYNVPSRYGSSVSLMGAEYMLVHMQRPQEPTVHVEEDYWHCGFSSSPVKEPVEGRTYL